MNLIKMGTYRREQFWKIEWTNGDGKNALQYDFERLRQSGHLEHSFGDVVPI